MDPPIETLKKTYRFGEERELRVEIRVYKTQDQMLEDIKLSESGDAQLVNGDTWAYCETRWESFDPSKIKAILFFYKERCLHSVFAHECFHCVARCVAVWNWDCVGDDSEISAYLMGDITQDFSEWYGGINHDFSG